MPTIAGPATDAISELKISPDGARRFIVGLSWTPRELPQVKVDVASPPERGDTTGKMVYFLMKPFDLLRIFFLSVFKLAKFDSYAGKSYKLQDKEGRDA